MDQELFVGPDEFESYKKVTTDMKIKADGYIEAFVVMSLQIKEGDIFIRSTFISSNEEQVLIFPGANQE